MATDILLDAIAKRFGLSVEMKHVALRIISGMREDGPAWADRFMQAFTSEDAETLWRRFALFVIKHPKHGVLVRTSGNQTALVQSLIRQLELPCGGVVFESLHDAIAIAADEEHDKSTMYALLFCERVCRAMWKNPASAGDAVFECAGSIVMAADAVGISMLPQQSFAVVGEMLLETIASR
jgi:hypothetical protein